MFDLVIAQHTGVIDAKTGELLLRKQAMDAVQRLCKNMAADCVSDPEGLGMYDATGKSARV